MGTGWETARGQGSLLGVDSRDTVGAEGDEEQECGRALRWSVGTLLVRAMGGHTQRGGARPRWSRWRDGPRVLGGAGQGAAFREACGMKAIFAPEPRQRSAVSGPPGGPRAASGCALLTSPFWRGPRVLQLLTHLLLVLCHSWCSAWLCPCTRFLWELGLCPTSAVPRDAGVPKTGWGFFLLWQQLPGHVPPGWKFVFVPQLGVALLGHVVPLCGHQRRIMGDFCVKIELILGPLEGWGQLGPARRNFLF